jgi:hypothetical protein
MTEEQVRTSLGLPPLIPDLGRLTYVCEVCSQVVQVMCFKGSGVCSELCRKTHIQKEQANA